MDTRTAPPAATANETENEKLLTLIAGALADLQEAQSDPNW
jgi:hypothetical protein